MSRPYKYSESPSGKVEPDDWDALVDLYNGFTPSGTFKQAADYIISEDGTDTYASDAYQNIYGGPDDDGGIDGGDAQAVFDAAIGAADTAGGGLVFIKAGDYTLDSATSLIGINNVTIAGAGRGATNILTHGFEKEDSTPTYNVEIRDLTIDIDDTADAYGISLAHYCYGFRLRNLELKDTNNVFLLRWGYVDNLIVENCVFSDGGLSAAADNCAGAQYKNGNNTSIFRNNLFLKDASAGGAMLTTADTGNLLVDGNCFIDKSAASYAAVSIENSYGTCKNIQIVNNYAFALGLSIGNNDTNQIESGIVANNVVVGSEVDPVALSSGITVTRCKQAVIANNTLIDTEYGCYTRYCNQANILGNIIKNTDIQGDATATRSAIYAVYNDYTRIANNNVFDDAGTTPYGIYAGNGDIYINDNILEGPFTTASISFPIATDYAKVVDNHLDNSASIILGLANVTTEQIHHNTGYITENSGSGSITNGTTSDVIAHGLSYTPTADEITIVFTENPTNSAGTIWISGIGAANFTVNCENDPGASNLDFSWSVRRID